MIKKLNARYEAQKQWNSLACGELTGDKNTIEYFEAVSINRYTEQNWMHDYFRFSDFKDQHVLEIELVKEPIFVNLHKMGHYVME